ncbi:MAG: UDP-3-O-acyl-N-acetylglucosamine deacetylase [Rhizobiaceae bacterium]|nr:UDP-3-O-acyl-N-acetylglucosamine deacetylase [Rhizobiaceae bacterium]
MVLDWRGLQSTVRRSTFLSGTGVHSGERVSLAIHPADANSGIVFHLASRSGGLAVIPAHVTSVSGTDLCTAVGNSSAQIATIEHLMAALYAAGIDNAVIEVDSGEIPVLDGSAAPFMAALDEAGVETQDAPRRYIRVKKAVRIESGASWAEFRPYQGTRFEVEIDFACQAIGRQRYAGDITAESFKRELSRARTFGFLKDVERLWAAGLALGSSLENTVVLGHDDRPINPEGLRYIDEFVRHKALDAVGDLALAGAQFIGCFRSYRGGHALNAKALRLLLSDKSAFEIVEARQPKTAARGADFVAVPQPVFAPWVL